MAYYNDSLPMSDIMPEDLQNVKDSMLQRQAALNIKQRRIAKKKIQDSAWKNKLNSMKQSSNAAAGINQIINPEELLNKYGVGGKIGSKGAIDPYDMSNTIKPEELGIPNNIIPGVSLRGFRPGMTAEQIQAVRQYLAQYNPELDFDKNQAEYERKRQMQRAMNEEEARRKLEGK